MLLKHNLTFSLKFMGNHSISVLVFLSGTFYLLTCYIFLGKSLALPSKKQFILTGNLHVFSINHFYKSQKNTIEKPFI